MIATATPVAGTSHCSQPPTRDLLSDSRISRKTFRAKNGETFGSGERPSRSQSLSSSSRFIASIKLRRRNKVAHRIHPSQGLGFSRFQESLKLAYPRRVPHFTQRLGLDLPNPFTRHAKLPADFLKRPAIAIHQSEAL